MTSAYDKNRRKLTISRRKQSGEPWWKKEDYNFLERAKVLGDAISKQPNLLPAQIAPSFFSEYKNFEDLKEAYKNKVIGKQYIDNELNKLNAAWNLLPDGGKRGIINTLQAGAEILGGTWEDLKTVEGAEKYDPIDWITSGVVHGIDYAGDKLDKFVAKPTAGFVHNRLGIDKRGAELAGLAAETFLTRRALKTIPQAINLVNRGIASKQAHNLAAKAGKKAKKLIETNPLKPPSKRVVPVKGESIIDDVMSYDTETITKARNIYKHHPDAGWTAALTRARQLKGVTNKALIKESTDPNLTRGYKTRGLFDPNRDDTTKFQFASTPKPRTVLKPIVTGDTGMGQLSVRGKGESYPQYFNKIMTQYGARKENGYWIMDEDTFRAIPTSNERREVAQMLLTQLSQGVKRSFPKSKSVMNLKMNEDLARYNKKYAARADLHHGYPTVIGIEFFLGIPYMGKVWKNQMNIAAKWGNVPGQPMVEGKSNFVSLPSSIPSTKTRKWGPVTKVKYPNPDYQQAAERLERLGKKVPQHIHQLIHDSFLTNEMGQRGQKFWAKWDPIIAKNPSDATWLAAYEDFNEIIARNRAIYNEAMSQLEAIFSTNPLSENPAKIVDMLEEYIAKGKVTVGKGIVRDKNGKLVILKGKAKTVEYSQDAVKYELEEALTDFKKDIRQKRIEQDPRYKDVVEEIEYFPKLTFEEMTRMEELLYDIKTYNQVYVETNFNAKKTYWETRITKAQHKANLEEYYDLWHPKLFKLLDTGKPKPKIYNIKKLQTTTHRRISLGEEVQLILDFPVRQLDIFNDLF